MSHDENVSFLVPPRACRRLPGRFVWPAGAVLSSARRADETPLRQLAERLRSCAGVNARLDWSAGGPAAVRIRREPAVRGPEAYRLRIERAGVTLSAAADAGVYYGLQTLGELVEMHGGRLPCARIEDAPDFARRGVYLDCARGKLPTVDTLKALIERLAHWKVNELQLYIKNAFVWRAHPAIGRGFGQYTPDDLLAVQEHARRHHVRFVPSLASFSHMETILALPRYRSLAELPGAMGWRGGTCLCPGDPGSIRLIADLYNEFVPLFEAQDFNVCCDETWELGKGRSQTRARRVGVGVLYVEFLLKLHRLCERHGKRMNAWGDIVLKHPELIPRLPKDVVMLNWDYAARGERMPRTAEFAAAGIPVMVCPGTGGWTTHGSRLNNAMGNVAHFARVGRRVRAAGLLNTDWGDYAHRNMLGASLHGMAHGAAHAWNGRGVDDGAFTERFTRRLFGDEDGRLAEAWRTLGDMPETVARGGGSPAALYHLLVEPIAPPATRFVRRLDPITPAWHYPEHFPTHMGRTPAATLEEVVRRLSGIGRWPACAPGVKPFDRLAWDEMRLALGMDSLAARHGLLGQAARDGRRMSARVLRRWADDLTEAAAEFRRLWLARNVPPRLKDNLALMAMAAQECRALAKR